MEVELETPATIFFMGDFHIGNINCDMEMIERAFSLVDKMRKSRNVYVIGMGDFVDAITHNDTRYDYRESCASEYGTVAKQYRKVHSLFKSIKSTVIGLLEGNHEYTLAKYTQNEIVDDICDSLDIPSLGFLANVIVNKSIGMVLTHGNSKAASPNGKRRVVELWSNAYPSDRVFAYGHVHECDVWKAPYLYRGRVENKWMMLTGTFLHTYKIGGTGYGERSLFPPLNKGWAELVIEKDGTIHGGVRD